MSSIIRCSCHHPAPHSSPGKPSTATTTNVATAAACPTLSVIASKPSWRHYMASPVSMSVHAGQAALWRWMALARVLSVWELREIPFKDFDSGWKHWSFEAYPSTLQGGQAPPRYRPPRSLASLQ
ncbi:hypothetical protein E2C01_029115 [Portunus trituberculatus]|uniref:Uncharacterized protein n=1 Tax=Portunus trituberculatus TaxID=210409 RepID=A0A5B7ER47_PORTR|nr:hypothetical protein [Portunus trituberculatus]